MTSLYLSTLSIPPSHCLLLRQTCATRSDKKPPIIAPIEPPTRGTHDTNHSSWEADIPTSCQGEPVSLLQQPSTHHGKASLQTCLFRRRRSVRQKCGCGEGQTLGGETKGEGVSALFVLDLKR